jgi:EAL domain-containing protein (putative c-di-GMP-specific phosphodiesterase class I)
MDVTRLLIPAQARGFHQFPEMAQDPAVHLEIVLRDELIHPAYQPIVDLGNRRVVAYEALARGPRNGPLASPAALFGQALTDGRLAELDWLCRIRALEGAQAAGLGAPLTLFVNVEPATAMLSVPEPLRERFAAASEGLRIVVEFTERALTARPAELLATAERVRAAGWGLALDDVGAEPQSLALMPFLRPDVIKLDLRLVQQRPDADVAAIMTAVSAYAERTGCEVLAEGIETAEHVALAHALGARLGQGWLFGRPGPLPDVSALTIAACDLRRPVGTIERIDLQTAGRSSLYGFAAERRASLRTTKPLLIEVSKLLEREALALGDTAVILGAFEHDVHFTRATRTRYIELAERLAFVGALGRGIAPTPALGVRGAVLHAEDPVVGEWHVAVMAPHFSAALVASDLGDTGPDTDRRFDYILTYDRDLVSQIAVGLMARMLPAAHA